MKKKLCDSSFHVLIYTQYETHEKIRTDTESIIHSIERLESKIQEKDFSDAENHKDALDELSGAVIALESFMDILERDDENEEMKKHS